MVTSDAVNVWKAEVGCCCYVTERKQDAHSTAEMSSGFSANQVIYNGLLAVLK